MQRLRAHLRDRTGITESVVGIGGDTYRIVRPASADALIDEGDFERDERLPYWAELWPSALALARSLGREDLAGRRAVELGCGLGLPTVAALARGARVLATDHYEAALDFTIHNARTNLGREPQAALLDWHAPRMEHVGVFDLVFAADVLYERRSATALARLIPGLVSPDGEAIFADPRRAFAPLFLELMAVEGFRTFTQSVTVEWDGREVRVLMHRLRRF